jgi:hypothetical protein
MTGACVTAGAAFFCLLLSAGSHASAAPIPISNGTTVFTGTITLLQPLQNAYFVYDANQGADVDVIPMGNNGSVPSTCGGPFCVAVPFTQTAPFAVTSGFATAIGLYSNSGVSIGVNQNTYNAALNNESWSQVFPNTTEASIVTALQNGDQATLESFLTQYSNEFVNFSSLSTGLRGGILNFSNATNGGTFALNVASTPGTPNVPPGGPSATPEPASYLMFGLGILGFGLAKFRKQLGVSA